jgi:hypothetical protein
VEVPVPGERDLKKALRIYVAGRNRAWTADEKRQAAGADDRRTDRFAGIAFAEEGESRIGVPVPETLQFHRGPLRWRGDTAAGTRRGRGPRED